MINVGIIGAGFFGERHARAISELPDVRLVAACRTDGFALRAFTQKYGVAGYTDYRELLNDAEVDTVVIATPHHLHTEVALQAAAAGKHILLEKPMAPTLAECDQILEAVETADIKFLAGHISHFAPSYQMAKELLNSGELGEVVLGVSTMSKLWFEPNRRGWHLDRITGGGMWLTAAMHCLDRMTWLAESEIVSVCAQFDTRFHDQQADDVGMVFVRYANGAVGTVVGVGYQTGAPKHWTELTCTRGALNVDYEAGLVIGRDETWRAVRASGSANWMHEALLNEWRSFARAIELDIEPAVSASYARKIMAAVFAAEEPSRLRKEVPLP